MEGMLTKDLEIQGEPLTKASREAPLTSEKAFHSEVGHEAPEDTLKASRVGTAASATAVSTASLWLVLVPGSAW